MQNLYEDSDILLFPSRLETWGLPLSEAKLYGLGILASSTPFSKEAIGNYKRVSFIETCNVNLWSQAIKEIIDNNYVFEASKIETPDKPFAKSWDDLWRFICKDL